VHGQINVNQGFSEYGIPVNCNGMSKHSCMCCYSKEHLQIALYRLHSRRYAFVYAAAGSYGNEELRVDAL
jgi:hypothetical protein